MRVKYLDLKTGKTAWDEGVSEFALRYGELSCDCNRIFAFAKSGAISKEECFDDDELCRSERFIAVEIEKEPGDRDFNVDEALEDANLGYYSNLVDYRYLLSKRFHL